MFQKPLKYGLFLLGAITGINLFIILIFSSVWSKLSYLSFGQILFFLLASFVSSFIITVTIIFTAPVYIGDTILAFVEVLEVSVSKNRVVLETTCKNQKDEVVIKGKALVAPPKK